MSAQEYLETPPEYILPNEQAVLQTQPFYDTSEALDAWDQLGEGLVAFRQALGVENVAQPAMSDFGYRFPYLGPTIHEGPQAEIWREARKAELHNQIDTATQNIYFGTPIPREPHIPAPQRDDATVQYCVQRAITTIASDSPGLHAFIGDHLERQTGRPLHEALYDSVARVDFEPYEAPWVVDSAVHAVSQIGSGILAARVTQAVDLRLSREQRRAISGDVPTLVHQTLRDTKWRPAADTVDRAVEEALCRAEVAVYVRPSDLKFARHAAIQYFANESVGHTYSHGITHERAEQVRMAVEKNSVLSDTRHSIISALRTRAPLESYHLAQPGTDLPADLNTVVCCALVEAGVSQGERTVAVNAVVDAIANRATDVAASRITRRTLEHIGKRLTRAQVTLLESKGVSAYDVHDFAHEAISEHGQVPSAETMEDLATSLADTLRERAIRLERRLNQPRSQPRKRSWLRFLFPRQFSQAI